MGTFVEQILNLHIYKNIYIYKNTNMYTHTLVGDLSRVDPVSRPIIAGIDSSPPRPCMKDKRL